MRNTIVLLMAFFLSTSLYSVAGENRLDHLGSIGSIAFADNNESAGSEPIPHPEPAKSGLSGILEFNVGWATCPNMKGFKASTDSGSSLFGSSPRHVERDIDSSGSGALGLNFGLEFHAEGMDTAVLFGVGALLNSDVDSTYTELSIEPLFKVSDGVKIGPTIGFMGFRNTEWELDSSLSSERNEPDIEFEGGTGGRYGIKLVSNGDSGHFVISISYIDFAYGVIDARTDSSKHWVAHEDELDISGISLYLGLRF